MTEMLFYSKNNLDYHKVEKEINSLNKLGIFTSKRVDHISTTTTDNMFVVTVIYNWRLTLFSKFLILIFVLFFLKEFFKA